MTNTAGSSPSNYKKLAELLGKAKNGKKLLNIIVNAPFEDKVQAARLGLGNILILIINNEARTLDKIAFAHTETASKTVMMSAKLFNRIRIPLDHDENIIIRSFKTGKPQKTSDWKHLFSPSLNPEEARLYQADAGIGCSVTYPLASKGGGVLIYSYYLPPDKVSSRQVDFMDVYSKIVSDRLSQASG